MAEFVQTMKDWRRMCQAMEKKRPNDACSGCRLEGYGCPAIYEDNSHVDFADVEKNVTAWAAEHPVVYPTWSEWLYEQGVLKDQVIPMPTMDDDSSRVVAKNVATEKLDQQIPADIAVKLEIKPKEG